MTKSKKSGKDLSDKDLLKLALDLGIKEENFLYGMKKEPDKTRDGIIKVAKFKGMI